MSKFYFSNVIVFMISYFEPNFIEKFLWESGFSNFRHFETVQFFDFFFANMIVFSVYIYGIQMITKFRWETGFLGG